MTVRELIEKLQAMPQDALVVTWNEQFGTLEDIDAGVWPVKLSRVGGEPFIAVEIDGHYSNAPTTL
jgi:hypothetical protein